MDLPKFLPQVLPISSFGAGGFRFGSYSHLGSLLVLPDNMQAWKIGAELQQADFAEVLKVRADIDCFLLGTGVEMKRPSLLLCSWFSAQKLNVEFMSTSSAVHTYNVMLAEGRRFAAGFRAVV
jgi:uncharacterized protein